MRASLLLAMTILMSASDVQAQPYFNERFGYQIELSQVFKIVNTADNGDGLSLQTSDGSARLLVFGANILEGGFAAEVARRKQLAVKDGWNITYTKSGPNWASYSGLKAGSVIYVRAITLCDDTVGYFTIEYPSTRQKQFGPIVTRLTRTMIGPKNCE